MNKYKAFVHYLKSAEMDHSIGIFKTAICYYYSIGVEESYSKYKEWIEK
jgi:TPR repeat protein